MSNFDNGLTLGLILGRKQGGGGTCPPPEIKSNISYTLRSAYDNNTYPDLYNYETTKPDSSLNYVIEDIP